MELRPQPFLPQLPAVLGYGLCTTPGCKGLSQDRKNCLVPLRVHRSWTTVAPRPEGMLLTYGLCVVVVSLIVIFLGIVCISLLLEGLCFPEGERERHTLLAAGAGASLGYSREGTEEACRRHEGRNLSVAGPLPCLLGMLSCGHHPGNKRWTAPAATTLFFSF